MLVKDIMTENVIAANTWNTVKEAADTMLKFNIGGLPIIDEDRNLVGILTETDFIGSKVNVPHAMVSLTKLLGQTHYKADITEVFDRSKDYAIERVMTKKVYSLSPETTLSDANEVMVRNKISRLPVIKNNKLVGIITKRDILKKFARRMASEVNSSLELAPT